MKYLKIDNLEDYLSFSRKLSEMRDEIRKYEETFLEKIKRHFFNTPTTKDNMIVEYNRIKGIFDKSSRKEKLIHDKESKKIAEMAKKYGWTYDYEGAYDCDGNFGYAPGFLENPKG